MGSSSDAVTILFTADLHGRISPLDVFSGEPIERGLARTATRLAAARERDPDAVYLDLGDLVQGTPMSYLHIKERPSEIHPMVRVLNRLGCEGMVVGNHEFNFGLPWIESLRRTAEFPILAANVLGPDGTPFFEPVLRLERRGRRIAILAITSPQVPRWEEPWNIEGLTFRDGVETVREWVPRLRRDSDAVVVAAHMGWEGVTDGGLEDPAPHENDIGRLVREVEDLDVVLMAHTHRIDERRAESGTLAVQAGSGGEALGEVTLSWAQGEPRPHAAFRVDRVGLDTPPNEEIQALVADDERRAAERVSEVVGVAESPFRIEGARYRDNAILTLLHKVQLEASGAELSTAALFREREGLEAGSIRVLDLYRIYPYENDLTVVELTVDDVREYLEQTAQAYLGPAANGLPPPLHPGITVYNHDAIAGAEYVIDPRRPAGSRITSLAFRGEERGGQRKVTLAMTSYRAQGGGGYAALRRARVVKRTGHELRGLLIEYVRRHASIAPEVFHNWRVEGLDVTAIP